jgi:hypothetical protein
VLLAGVVSDLQRASKKGREKENVKAMHLPSHFSSTFFFFLGNLAEAVPIVALPFPGPSILLPDSARPT